MAYVKFIKGTTTQYANKVDTYKSDGSIFFATDDSLIYANGHIYGISKEEKDKLGASVKSVEVLEATAGDTSLKLKVTYTNDTTANFEIPAVTDTRNGLMTPTQKSNLEDAYEQAVTGGAGTLKNQVAENKVSSSDKTVVVTLGSTAAGGTITGTDIKVNIDGETIVKDAETGALSVASAALTQYVGDGKTVEVSAVDASKNEKTISFAGKIAEITTGLPATVAKAYELQDKNGDPINASSRILIPKDNSFVTGQAGTMGDTINEATGDITSGTGNAALDLVYINNEGKYVLVKIDIEEYLKEAEFKDGFALDGHNVKVKLSTNTESAKYLKIQAIAGENGAIELTGIDAAIKAASSSIAAKNTGHVTVSSTSDTNGTVYTIAENDIASAQDLSNETTRAKAAEKEIADLVGITGEEKARAYDNTGTYIGKSETKTVKNDIRALDAAVAGLAGNAVKDVTVNGVDATVENNKATVEIDGSNVKINKDASKATEVINTNGTIKKGDTLAAAIAAVEAQLLWYEAD